MFQGEFVGSEGRRGRWGIPTLALHIRIQHREYTDNESQIPNQFPISKTETRRTRGDEGLRDFVYHSTLCSSVMKKKKV